MALFNALELWLLCCTHTSVTLIIIYFDDVLWNKLLAVAKDIYGSNRKAIPTKLHPSIKSIREDIRLFTKSHCKFVLELPRFSGEIGPYTVSSLGSPYSICLNVHISTPGVDLLHEKMSVLLSECKLIFKETHSCLRQLARELGTFMLNNKDRLYEEDIPNCAPMAYVMKGKCLPIETL